ncbi:hypothetical protein [Neogemmobacter tilapiae]|uniref:hypothetical protein n=1 Tax=Neogemmobacter tilapiae TaxID=875041 RepID=UPI0016768AD0|nr:hypothetical protein [Gemmobacter tilapiae]
MYVKKRWDLLFAAILGVLGISGEDLGDAWPGHFVPWAFGCGAGLGHGLTGGKGRADV